MLDADTKRRIDTARDILVGKVPDPKSQVEQITIALIYKFMDDMDAASEELGGERTFFAGDFARYGWAKLMQPGIGGHDMLNLYAEAIVRMPENPGIPQLFRDIFNNAFLPYRDPETLRAFLKVINEFTYDHSERLGDAYEYLLSVLDSQGDAGQFRTPRHIIDFIVAVVDPKKDETILDPACGTAGFLISAYKHILAANTDDDGQSTLTPDERGRLVSNFSGYDISPDMVRLSLVNMYLHEFWEPHIHEYDTLTSEDRWNEYADVILANPPFMSPRGGIRPHNRFSVKSKRSEVLFVDYMAEHLSASGRAGIIVPEGIIFQSQTAYKLLRKMLVENYLVAVVSLPAGVFRPYSGVKTSILILDRSLAKQTDAIAFFKVENDGFDLGAQRRTIAQNDLPKVQAELGEYLGRIRENLSMEDFRATLGTVVKKQKIEAGGEYYLSGERYRENGIRTKAKWPIVRLLDVCELYQPKTITQKDIAEEGDYPVFGANGIIGRYHHYNHEESEVLITCRGATCGTVNLSEPKSWITGNAMVATPKDRRISKSYLYALLKGSDLTFAITGSAQPQITRTGLATFQIPLPPLEVQRELVAEIEGYQKVIDGARAVVENYQPHIAVDPEWPECSLGSLANNLDSRRVPVSKELRKPGPIPYYGASGVVDFVNDYIFDEDILLVSEDGANLLARSTPIAFSVSGKSWVNNHAHVLKFRTPYVQKYVECYLNSVNLQEYVTGSAQPKLNQNALSGIPIPLPDDETLLKGLVSDVEAEQSIIWANRELIQRFENKIQFAVARVWGEELPRQHA